jgi:hypothetical protein
VRAANTWLRPRQPEWQCRRYPDVSPPTSASRPRSRRPRRIWRSQGGLKEEKGVNRILKRELLQPRGERAQPRDRGGASFSRADEGVGVGLAMGARVARPCCRPPFPSDRSFAAITAARCSSRIDRRVSTDCAPVVNQRSSRAAQRKPQRYNRDGDRDGHR